MNRMQMESEVLSASSSVTTNLAVSGQMKFQVAHGVEVANVTKPKKRLNLFHHAEHHIWRFSHQLGHHLSLMVQPEQHKLQV